MIVPDFILAYNSQRGSAVRGKKIAKFVGCEVDAELSPDMLAHLQRHRLVVCSSIVEQLR